MYGSESLSWVAKRSGAYLIRISSVNKKAAPGAYEVIVDAPRAARPEDEVRIAAQRHVVTGNDYYEARKLHQAFDEFSNAKRLWQQIGDRVQEAVATNHIGHVLSDMGDAQKALAQHKEALSISQSVNDRFEEAAALNGLGWNYYVIGENQAALNYYRQALSLRRSVGDRQGEAVVLRDIGAYYRDLGESQKSLDSLSQALSISRDIGDGQSEGGTLLVLGDIYRSLNDAGTALAFLKQALNRSREAKDAKLEIDVLSAMGDVYRSLGDTPNALAVLDRAVRQNKSLGDQRGLAQRFYDMGGLYASQGDRAGALDYYQRALSINQKVGDHRGQVKVLYTMGVILRLSHRHQQALRVLRQTLTLSRVTSDRRTEANTLYLLAQVTREQGDLRESLNLIRDALEIADSLRYSIGGQTLRASYFAAVQEYYEFYIDLLMGLHKLHPDQGFAQAALEANESARVRSLLETLTDARVAGHETAGRGSLRETSLPRILTVKEIQEQIVDDDTVLLEYALGIERSFLWAVTPDSVRVYELPGRSEVEISAKKVYQLISTHTSLPSEGSSEYGALAAARDEAYLAEADDLSRMLFGPVAEHLGSKRLLIVGQGALQYIPFEVLPAPKTSGTEKEPRLLINDHEITYLPSASALALLRREAADRKPASKAIAVIADPVFQDDDPRVRDSSDAGRLASTVKPNNPLPRLPASRWEAEEILASTPPDQRMAAFSFAANRHMAISGELAKYRIIHFATHGIINNEHPEQSAIMLSLVDEQGQQQNGSLQLRDIYNLDLPADLVVLSACNTALGKDIKGEGIVGLTQSFMSAGARGVVTSLWKVDDRATADLMARFYKNMLRDGLTPAAALRKAKVQMSREGRWRHPYYWAAFILQGDGNQNVLPLSRETDPDSYLYVIVLLPIGFAFVGVSLRRWYKKSNGKSKALTLVYQHTSAVNSSHNKSDT
jgi:CHAT domain-containing protein/tetratricopeptide (TPR) repeat protein